MKKIVLVVLGLLAVSMFLAGCAKGKALAGEAVELGSGQYQIQQIQQYVTLDKLNKAIVILKDPSPSGTKSCDYFCSEVNRTCIDAYYRVSIDTPIHLFPVGCDYKYALHQPSVCRCY